MRLSAMKINHLSHVLAQGLYDDDRIDFTVEKNEIRLRIKRLITDELRLDEEVDRIARNTIASYSKRIPEGSKEWEIVYKKIYSEQMKRRRGFDI